MCAGKEHLFDGWLRIWVSTIHPALGLTIHRLGIVFDVEGRDKFDTVLIESQRMAEVVDGIIRTAERQIFRNNSDGFDGVPVGS